MPRPVRLLAALACAAALPTVAHAQAAGRFALGVGGGTNGGSVDASFSLDRHFVVRAQGAFIDFDHDFKSSDVTYTGRFRHNTGAALLDVHPFANPFFVNAGVVAGQRKVKVDARPDAGTTVRIDGVRLPADQVGTITGDIDFGSTRPFAGLGFDNTFTHPGHWGFRAAAGVIFGQEPSVTLTAHGPFATQALVTRALEGEARSLRDDADDFRFYPVVQVGVAYRF